MIIDWLKRPAITRITLCALVCGYLPHAVSTEFDILSNVEEVLKISPVDSEENREISKKLTQVGEILAAKKYSQAAILLEELRQKKPLNYSFCYLQVLTYVGMQDWQEANNTVDNCIKIDNTRPLLYNLKGAVLAAVGRTTEALQQYNYAIFLNAKEPGSYLQRAKFIYFYYSDNEKMLAKALDDLRQYQFLSGQTADSARYLGLINLRLNQPDRAQSFFVEALQHNPGDLTVLKELVGYFYQQQQWKEAEKFINNAITHFNNNGGEQTQLGDLALLQAQHAVIRGNAVDAENYFKQAIDKQESKVQAFKEFIYWLDKQERLSETIELSKAALVYNPQDSYLVGYLAWALANQASDIPEAYSWLNKAKSMDPTNIYLSDTHAWLEARQGNFSNALEVIQPSITQAKNVPEIAYHAGFIYHNLDNPDKAVYYLKLALGSKESFTGRKEAEALLAQLNR